MTNIFFLLALYNVLIASGRPIPDTPAINCSLKPASRPSTIDWKASSFCKKFGISSMLELPYVLPCAYKLFFKVNLDVRISMYAISMYRNYMYEQVKTYILSKRECHRMHE